MHDACSRICAQQHPITQNTMLCVVWSWIQCARAPCFISVGHCKTFGIQIYLTIYHTFHFWTERCCSGFFPRSFCSFLRLYCWTVALLNFYIGSAFLVWEYILVCSMFVCRRRYFFSSFFSHLVFFFGVVLFSFKLHYMPKYSNAKFSIWFRLVSTLLHSLATEPHLWMYRCIQRAVAFFVLKPIESLSTTSFSPIFWFILLLIQSIDSTSFLSVARPILSIRPYNCSLCCCV